MKIDIVKLGAIIEDLSGDITTDSNGFSCEESGVFVGEINGNLIRLEVMSLDNAIVDHDFDKLYDEWNCVTE